MKPRQITDSLYEIPLGIVNAHLIVDEGALVLIDTGSAGSEERIFDAIRQVGREPSDLTHIILTHCHSDHTGSLNAIQAITKAVTLMHPLDAALVREGLALRDFTPAPGLLPNLLFRLFTGAIPAEVAPARVDQHVDDGDELPLAGGMQVIHAPGHCAGQIALLWRRDNLLFAADAVMNLPFLGYSLGYEDFELGQKTARRLAELEFEWAVFGHGRALLRNASRTFKRRFAQRPTDAP